tara:strand:+ start:6974 stop:9316 length:2343 start_codon:yes stop_codon:yes gene_type:complete
MGKYISIILLYSISFSQEIIGEGLSGQLLLNYVVNNYKTSATLGYTAARDTLYGTIDLREGNQLSCVYSGYTITLDITQDPSINAYNQGINCEHTYPQSMGAGEEPQKSDMHHLFPCKSNVNSSRGNDPYAEIPDENTNTWYRNNYSQNTIPTDYIEEYAEKYNPPDPTDQTFEPREDHKGDASRAVFYFLAMYNDVADTNFWNEQKDVLLDWHYYDEVDEWEMNRTWSIASYQENQPNPFVLDSSLARRIWYMNDSDYQGPVWHVSRTGSDSTGDGSEENPFATIQAGIDAAIDGDTVLVAAGTYVENINFNGKNISVIGADRETTIIDGNQDVENVVTFESGEDSTTVLSGFTITNGAGILIGGSSPTLQNLNITNNWSATAGGGIQIKKGNIYNGYASSSSQIKNTIISYNYTQMDGGAVSISEFHTLLFQNVLIYGNSSQNGSHGFYSYESNSMLINITIANNSAGSGLMIGQADTLTLINSIISNNGISINDASQLLISYSNIQGGWTGIGNIDTNPLFCNPDSGNYTLAENSPCVGTGENGANMGAFGVGCGPYNFSPTDFSLSAPSNNAQITIDDSNMNDGFITFSWDESSDENGDSLVYLLHATSTEIEDFSLDTNITSIDIPYMELVDEMSENNITSATIEWTVDVTDGIDTVTADNAPFTLNVDGSDALSAFAGQLTPQVFALHQNYPNPFNPTTTLKYDLPEDAMVNITIYDMIGRVVKTMVNSQQNTGFKSVRWNATNDNGSPVSAGLYLYTIQAGEFKKTKKMVLLK